MIGSVSKQFIASGIMVLVQDGKLSLDDKINKYLESPPAAWEPITIRHLLTHTSGLVRESPDEVGACARCRNRSAEATLEQMWQPTKLNDGSLSHYGFGWEVGPANGHAQIKHGGSLAGFRSYYLRLPQDDLTVMVLTNLQTAPVDTIALGVAQKYVPGLFPVRTSIKLKRSELERYVGRYQLGPAGIVTVSIVGDQLQLSAAVLGDSLLSPETSSLFFVTDDSRAQTQFTAKDDGTLELAYMLNGSTAVKGPKLP